jgi:ABC-type oligopeptide transport system ATPase subunit
VGVGWGNYVIAWLLTYNGADCRLWQYVYERCMEAELCRRVLELLPSIGLDVRKHKCYAELDTEIVEADQAPNQPKHPNHPTAQNHPSSSNRLSPRNKHLLKRSKTKLLKTTQPPMPVFFP